MANDDPIFFQGDDEDNLIYGGDNDDTLYGGAGDDTFYGGEGADLIYGEDGNDYIADTFGGDNGGNTMFGGAGDDRLQASQHPDYLDGGTGNDRLIGNGGDDTLIGGLGNDTTEGGSGRDIHVMTQEAGATDLIRHLWAVTSTAVIDMTDFEAIHAYEDLTLVQNGSNVEILLADDQKIILDNVQIADVPAERFIFAPIPLADLFSSASDSIDLNAVQEADYLAGTQTINALGGNDAVLLADANNWAYTAGALFSGGSGNDTLTGGIQNDVLDGAAGNDELTGGAGEDTFVFTQEAGASDVITDFTSGEDVVDLTDGSFADISVFSDLAITYENGGARVQLGNNHTIFLAGVAEGTLTAHDFAGVDADPVLTDLFSSASDSVNLNTVQETDYLAGTQTTNAQDGDDVIVLADANNWAYTAGVLFSGGSGNDSLTGGIQNDVLDGAAGDDELTGGAGEDTFVFTQEAGASDVITDFTSGEDVVDLTDGSFADISVFSDLGVTYENGGATVQLGNGHSVFLAGVSLLSAEDFVGVNADPEPEPDAMQYGTEGNDVFNGQKQDDMYDGLGGNDTINGKKGNDLLRGGDGNDYINGGGGKDTLEGGDGNDIINGDNGQDSIFGGAGNDVIYSKNGGDYIDGGTGNDLIYADNGSDTLLGGDGNDAIYSGNAKDLLIGGAGNDLLFAGNGNDTLIGGTGRDGLYGGSGKDIFVFESLEDSTNSNRDIIMDFSNGDKIDLSGLGFDGISRGSGNGANLGYSAGWLTTTIYDAESDFSIQLLGHHNLDAGDFIF
jgi:Ca2+-binding RTX toxin-like protein